VSVDVDAEFGFFITVRKEDLNLPLSLPTVLATFAKTNANGIVVTEPASAK
jgi:hypothetical protein